jgi:hypothetical protein
MAGRLKPAGLRCLKPDFNYSFIHKDHAYGFNAAFSPVSI